MELEELMIYKQYVELIYYTEQILKNIQRVKDFH